MQPLWTNVCSLARCLVVCSVYVFGLGTPALYERYGWVPVALVVALRAIQLRRSAEDGDVARERASSSPHRLHVKLGRFASALTHRRRSTTVRPVQANGCRPETRVHGDLLVFRRVTTRRSGLRQARVIRRQMRSGLSRASSSVTRTGPKPMGRSRACSTSTSSPLVLRRHFEILWLHGYYSATHLLAAATQIARGRRFADPRGTDAPERATRVEEGAEEAPPQAAVRAIVGAVHRARGTWTGFAITACPMRGCSTFRSASTTSSSELRRERLAPFGSQLRAEFGIQPEQGR